MSTFPNDAITVFDEISGDVTHTLVSGSDPKTILGITLQQSKDLSDTTVKCGTVTLAKNYGKDFPQTLTNYQCTSPITVVKTGNDLASIIVTYVPYLTTEYSTTTQYGYNPHVGIASSSDIEFYGSFSAGEMLIGFLLLIQIFFMGLYALVKSFGAIKTKKRYIEYDRKDVGITEQL